MKNMKKIILVALLIMVSLSLCSCTMIDEIRETRVEMTEEGTIIHNNKEYKLLSNPNNYIISLENSSETDYLTVVDKEVPVLLTDIFGVASDYDDVLDIIYMEGDYYCAEENYDKYSEILLNGKLDYYKLDYGVYERTSDGEHEYKSIRYILNKDLVNIINSVTVDIEIQPDEIYKYYEYNYILLDKCDETGFIENSSFLMLYKNAEKGEYGVFVYDNVNDVYKGNVFTGEQRKAIVELFDKYYEDVNRGFKKETVYYETTVYSGF